MLTQIDVDVTDGKQQCTKDAKGSRVVLAQKRVRTLAQVVVDVRRVGTPYACCRFGRERPDPRRRALGLLPR
jgi:hypothetical protein